MFVKLFRTVLNSTVWMMPDHVVRVWLTMLLLADQDGQVHVSIPGIAKEARVDLDKCLEAISALEAPDEFSQSKEEGGRRIIRIHEDEPRWYIVNYTKYRKARNAETKRAYDNEYMRQYRERIRKQNENVREVKEKSYESSQAEAEAYYTELSNDNSVVNSAAPSGHDQSEKKPTKRASVKWAVDLYVEKIVPLGKPAPRKMTEQRVASIAARIREYGEDAVIEAINKTASSSFLIEGNSSWDGIPGIDWIFGKKNFIKILEGQYDNKNGKSQIGKQGPMTNRQFRSKYPDDWPEPLPPDNDEEFDRAAWVKANEEYEERKKNELVLS